jgi:hypothetical protein
VIIGKVIMAKLGLSESIGSDPVEHGTAFNQRTRFKVLLPALVGCGRMNFFVHRCFSIKKLLPETKELR